MKAGWRSTEFWFMVAAAVLKMFAQSGAFGLEPDAFDAILYGGGLYSIGRGAAKMAGPSK